MRPTHNERFQSFWSSARWCPTSLAQHSKPSRSFRRAFTSFRSFFSDIDRAHIGDARVSRAIDSGLTSVMTTWRAPTCRATAAGHNCQWGQRRDQKTIPPDQIKAKSAVVDACKAGRVGIRADIIVPPHRAAARLKAGSAEFGQKAPGSFTHPPRFRVEVELASPGFGGEVLQFKFALRLRRAGRIL